MPKIKVTKEQRKAIHNARKIIDEAVKADANEAETRRRVDRIFGWVMGYKVFKHITREYAVSGPGETEHVDFAIRLEEGEDAEPAIMVELKRVGIGLAKKHLKQITSYAIDIGCEWALLTNGREWRLYHVEFGQPPKIEIFESWNLLDDNVDDLVCKFNLISYKSLRWNKLNKNWKRVKVLKPDTLLAAIISRDTLGVIRRNLHRNTSVRVDDEEVYRGIGKLLNEAAGNVMANIKIPPKQIKKRKASKPTAEIKEEDENKEAE